MKMGMLLDLSQILQITRVRQGIQIDQPVFRVLLQPVTHKIRTNKSGTAGY
jgi:hypothetical protein